MSETKEKREGQPPEREQDDRSDGTESPHSQGQNSDQPPPWWNLALQQLDGRFAVLQANMERAHAYVTGTVVPKTDATIQRVSELERTLTDRVVPQLSAAAEGLDRQEALERTVRERILPQLTEACDKVDAMERHYRTERDGERPQMAAGHDEPPEFSNAESAGDDDYESGVTSEKQVRSSEHRQLGPSLEATPDPPEGPPLGRHGRRRRARSLQDTLGPRHVLGPFGDPRVAQAYQTSVYRRGPVFPPGFPDMVAPPPHFEEFDPRHGGYGGPPPPGPPFAWCPPPGTLGERTRSASAGHRQRTEDDPMTPSYSHSVRDRSGRNRPSSSTPTDGSRKRGLFDFGTGSEGEEERAEDHPSWDGEDASRHRSRRRRTSKTKSDAGDRKSYHGRSLLEESRQYSSSDDSDSDIDRPRHKSPPLPKLPTFDGKPHEWRSFIFQFRQRAKYRHWSAKEKLEQLLACLRGKAVEYIFNRPKSSLRDYYALRDTLTVRYDISELPGTARRQLNSIRQEEQESLEDYADRVLVKVLEAYPKIEEDTAQGIGVENFLRGCKDKAAAYAAAEHRPETIQMALQFVKDSAANLKAFGRPAVAARQVTFAEPEVTDPTTASLKKEHERLLRMMSDVFQRLDVDPARRSDTGGSRRRTSPSPDRNRNRSASPCFNCQEPGHMARECSRPRRCYNCNQTGHIALDCKEPRRQRTQSPSRDGSAASKSAKDQLPTNSSGPRLQVDQGSE